MNISVQFQQILDNLFADNNPQKIAVGFSGGIDSLALLILLKEYCFSKNIQLTALIIDHNLHSDSTNLANQASKIADKLQIDSQILTILENNPQSNIENNLRQERFALFEQYCQQNDIKQLFLAHHQDDIAENFLIRLFRGSGIDGLSAINLVSKMNNLEIIRPLLNFSKDQLSWIVENNNLLAINDPTNGDDYFLRNKIRLFLKSLTDFDLISQRVAMSANLINQEKELIIEEFLQNSSEVLKFNDLGYFSLNLKQFSQLKPIKATRILAYGLMEVSGQYYKPRKAKIDRIYQEICQNNLQKTTCYGCVLEKISDQEIVIYRQKSAINLEVKTLQNNLGQIFDNRFLLKTEHKISLACDQDLNKLIKLKKINNFSGYLKNIVKTLPCIYQKDQIIAIPALNFGEKIDHQYLPKTIILK